MQINLPTTSDKFCVACGHEVFFLVEGIQHLSCWGHITSPRKKDPAVFCTHFLFLYQIPSSELQCSARQTVARKKDFFFYCFIRVVCFPFSHSEMLWTFLVCGKSGNFSTICMVNKIDGWNYASIKTWFSVQTLLYSCLIWRPFNLAFLWFFALEFTLKYLKN